MGDVERIHATFATSFGTPPPRVAERREQHGSGHHSQETPHDVLELHETEEETIILDAPVIEYPEEGHGLDLNA